MRQGSGIIVQGTLEVATVEAIVATTHCRLGDVSGAIGGMTSLQLATGFNNIQQNGVALVLAF